MKSKLVKIVGIVFLLGLVFGSGWKTKDWIGKKDLDVVVDEEEDVYVGFLLEIWEKIEENYWEKIEGKELSEFYQLAAEKLVGQPQQLKTNDKSGVKTMIEELLEEIEEDKKKEFASGVADMVLANLKPFGRSRLYSKKDETALSNTVKNINPEQDHFAALEIDKDAGSEEVRIAYKEKIEELEPMAKESTEAAKKLAEAKRAWGVLGEEDSREVYKTSGVEPTIEYRLINPEVLWVHLTKFSPTSLQEFARIAEKVDKGDELDGLILDLRDNIGGAIDGLPYFLGPFIGPDQYAYQFYHQGEKEDFKTRTGWLDSLVRYKKVVLLINGGTQSSAEVMAAVLKKYNVGVVVGTNTKGWGTVEKVFPIETKISDHETYSMFLVHRVTLREDGQPIEGRGVDPTISFSNKNWKEELEAYFEGSAIVGAVEEVK